ncbi:cytochrome P450 4F4-like [Glandiceps talaboti]
MAATVFLNIDCWYVCVDVVLVVAVALVGAVISKLVKLFMQMRRDKHAFKDFKCPPSHWFFGHMFTLMGSEEGLVNQGPTATEYGNYQIWLGPFTCMLCLAHPDSIKTLSKTTEPKAEITYGMLRPWLGDGLLLSNGQKWSRNRRLLTPGFHSDVLKPYVKVIGEAIQIMLDKWAALGPKKSINITQHINLMAFDVLLRCICSYESNCQIVSQDPYIQSVRQLLNLFLKRLRFPPFLSDAIFYSTYSGYKFKKACSLVHEKVRHVIEERKQHLKMEQNYKYNEKNRRGFDDFLDILLKARDEDGNGLTDGEIRDEVNTFMFAGHDTTASGLAWCLYHLAKHPEHQLKCREEINGVMDSKDKKILEWNDMAKLPYITMCIKETLRLQPPVPIIARKLTKPLLLPDGKCVPADHIVAINTFACHRNANVWTNPEIYDPGRFSSENSKDRPSHAFIPFAAGPRNCMGQTFAMNKLKVAVAMTINQFILSVDEMKTISGPVKVTLKVKNGIHLYIKPINPQLKPE